MADAGGGHIGKVTGDKAVPAPADADTFNALADSRAHHGADSRVHARGVPAAGENADTFDLFLHRSPRAPSKNAFLILVKLSKRWRLGRSDHLFA